MLTIFEKSIFKNSNNIERSLKKNFRTKILITKKSQEKNTNKFKLNNNFVLITSIILIIFCYLFETAESRKLLCSSCDVKNEIKYGKPAAKATYEEYIFEHQVTKLEAIENLKRMNYSLDGPIDPGCKAIKCTNKVMQYCLGGNFLNDHCWCEQGHEQEGLPFIPHSCFVGDGGGTANSCYSYLEVKECCCMRALIKRWKYLSAASDQHPHCILILLLVVSLCSKTIYDEYYVIYGY